MKKIYKDVLKLFIMIFIVFIIFMILHSMNQMTVKMRVLEVHDSYLLVDDLENRIGICRVALVASKSSDFKKDDIVIIKYNGMRNDTFPGSLEGVTKIKRLEDEKQ